MPDNAPVIAREPDTAYNPVDWPQVAFAFVAVLLGAGLGYLLRGG